jgi:hypothetical protein
MTAKNYVASFTSRSADWLRLGAAPTFAIMALLTRVLGDEQPDTLCLVMQDTWPLSGMIPMYLVMSAFHLPPWLKLMSRRRDLSPRGGSHALERSATTIGGTTM